MGTFVRSLAAAVLDVLGPDGRLVAIDGVDGSGKTTFAAALAAEIHDRPVITIHADDFLNPPTLRHARGRHSPEGFWQDTYDYRMLREYVLTPLGPKGDGWYSPVGYDPGADRPVEPVFSYAPPEALVLVEGMFLHRDELAAVWDASVFLDVAFVETAARMADRDGSNPDPSHPSMHRYVQGQRLYFDAAQPWERATFVIDNGDVATPRMIRPCTASAARFGMA